MSADPKNVSGNINSFHTNNKNPLSPRVDVVGANADPDRAYPGVGKTSLINRIVKNEYIEPAPRIDIAGVSTAISPGRVHFRDNSAADIKTRQRDCHALRHMDIVLCCYDVTDTQSFNFITENFDKIRSQATISGEVRFVLVATKCDEPEEKHTVSREMRQKLVLKEGAEYVETSAKTGMGCEELINILIPYRVTHLKEVEAEEAENARRCTIS
jgi:GTPase SAR1 family protein